MQPSDRGDRYVVITAQGLLTIFKSSCGFAEPTSSYLALTCADGLSLSGDDHHVLVELNAILVAQDARQHDLGAIADGVDLQTKEGEVKPRVLVVVVKGEERQMAQVTYSAVLHNDTPM